MAKKSAKTQNQRQNLGFGDMLFLDIALSDAEAERFSDYYAKFVKVSLEDLIGEVVIAGYKASFGYDYDGECAMATITCKDEDSVYNSTCITSRAEDAREAFLLSRFKYEVLGTEGDLRLRKRRKNWG